MSGEAYLNGAVKKPRLDEVLTASDIGSERLERGEGRMGVLGGPVRWRWFLVGFDV